MTQDYGNGSTLTVRVGGPYSGGSISAKLTEVTVRAADWKNAVSPFSQVVEVNGVSTTSRVDLYFKEDQIEAMAKKNLALVAVNDSGVITVFAYGSKPTEDITLDAVVLEVTAV